MKLILQSVEPSLAEPLQLGEIAEAGFQLGEPGQPPARGRSDTGAATLTLRQPGSSVPATFFRAAALEDPSTAR